MPIKKSPLAPKDHPDMPEVAGVRLATTAAAIKYAGRDDLAVMLFDEGTTVAGVFTRSKCPSAAVDVCRANLAGGNARMLVVNSGNANAFTGRKGKDATDAVAAEAAEVLSCPQDEIFQASTGVIGEPLDPKRITSHLASMTAEASLAGWQGAAQAIMTTDTYPKLATATAEIDGVTITINGMAKGSGMIQPDMATMLSFLATDAALDAPVLQALLDETVDTTFNAITVDSDTSTSDTLMLFATGKAEARGAPRIIDAKDPKLISFREALTNLLQDLALQVVRDGEGASKQVQITITGAESSASAKRVALSVANSPLVKTAIAGEDANWGRIVMAIGKAGEPADRDRLSIWFGDVRVAQNGERDPDYSEDAASAHMKNGEIVIRADVGVGKHEATVWTCDLTKEYVAINGDYRS